jgi:hypothetical protein
MNKNNMLIKITYKEEDSRLEAAGLRLCTRTLPLFTNEKITFYMVLLGLETKDQK